MQKINIGTRGSALALTQANWVKEQIETKYPESRVDLVKITTKGDKILDVPLAKVGGKGLFVKEIEEALLRNEVDIAVHSMKDVPTDLAPGLKLGVVTRREDPRDVLISRDGIKLADLPSGARVGTSSLRRSSQLLAHRPDFRIVSLRGNLDTRINKIKTDSLDAVIVAAAGLNRMAMVDKITEYISSEIMIPAIGQGALGIELRDQDEALLSYLSFLNHQETELAVRSERAFLKRLEGGCQVPIGALGEIDGNRITLRGIVADPEGARLFRKVMYGTVDNPEKLGILLAEEILAMGAKAVLEEVYQRNME